MFVFHLRDFSLLILCYEHFSVILFRTLYAVYYLFWEMKYSGFSYDSFFLKKQDGSRFVRVWKTNGSRFLHWICAYARIGILISGRNLFDTMGKQDVSVLNVYMIIGLVNEGFTLQGVGRMLRQCFYNEFIY